MKITKFMRFFLIALAAIMVFCLFACNDTETEGTESSEIEESESSSTTESKGEDSSVESDPPACDHADTLVSADAKAPTCTEIGWDAYSYCSNCDYTTKVEKPALGHDMQSVDAKAPTCTEKGWDAYTKCSRCDHTEGYTEKAATGHTPGAAATCIDAQKCTVCGAELAAPVAHTIKAVEAKAPTCYENGNIAYWYCEVCGYAWLDEACTLNTNLKAVVLPMGHAPATHVAAKASTCYENGNIEYWFCEACGQAWLDEACTLNTNLKAVKLPLATHTYMNTCDAHCMVCGELTNAEAKHTIKAVEAKAPTCFEPGNIAYWFCEDCGYAWTDEALTQVTNLKSVVLPITHTIKAVEAKAPTCFEPGNIAYWFCEDCGYAWTDEALTQVTNLKSVVLPITHTIKAVEAKAPTCFEPGNIAHWYCEACGQAWLDEACTLNTNLKAVVLPMAHAEATHVEAKAPTCYENGNIEYWFCEACGQAWLDEACTLNTNLKAVVLPMGHAPATHVAAKAPTCYENGNIEYWFCEACGQAWLDEACTLNTNLKAVVLPMAHAEATHVEAKAPTCYENGNIEYWFCEACGQAWLDEACTLNTNLKAVVLPMGHAPATHVAAKASTCTENGNIAYWYCADCGQAWLDEACTLNTNLKAVKLPLATHTYMNTCDAHCMVCGELTNAEAKHTIKAVEAKPVTCTENGNIAYWYCEICGSAWADADLTQVTNRMNVVIPATNHNWESCDAGKTCTVCGLTVVAKIGDTYYATLEAALAAANGETIVLVGNVALAAPITIAKDDVVVIDLAGFVLSYESTTMNEAMITNLGSLTIKDSGETGEIFYNYVGEADSSYGKGNYTISNAGTLVIDGGKIHIANIRQHAKYPVNNNSTSGNATLIVNGGHLYNYNTSAIRMFCNSTTYTNTVIINGGLVEGYCAIWVQNPGKNTVNGSLTINGGEIRTTAAAYVNGSATVAEVASKIYCTIDGEGGAWDEASFVKITGGLFNENVNLETAAPAVVEIGDGATFNGYVKIHVHEFVGFSCETDGVCSCGAIKPAGHTITYVEAKVPASCLETGHDEYWECTACGAYFGDADGVSQLNPAWMFFTGDHVRPEDAADCATVPCTACGEDTYGEGEHNVFACKGGLCTKCNAEIDGYGCANYDTPACEDGFCFYCGDPVEGFGHENGAWAPCQDGECSYGCGLFYPAAEDHVDDDADDYCDNCWNHLAHDVDPCAGGECSICWTYIEPVHTYMFECDAHCMLCGELTNEDAEHKIIAVEAKAPTCFEPGNIAHWYCEDCGYAWTDEALAQVTNLKSVVLPITHTIKAVEAKAPTCFEPGNIAHWYCEDCGYAWTDEALTQVTNLKNVVLPITHSIKAVEAKAPTCTENGNIAHWYCEDCGYAWTDEALTQVTNLKNVVIPATGHTAGAEATCTTNQICTVCNVELVAALGHDMQPVDAKAPTCTEKGWDAYTKCSGCDHTEGYTEIPELGHKYSSGLVDVDGQPGKIAYVCTICGHADRIQSVLMPNVLAGITTTVGKGADADNFPNGIADILVLNDPNYNNLPYLRIRVNQTTTENEAYVFINFDPVQKNVGKYVSVIYRNNTVTANEMFITTGGKPVGGEQVTASWTKDAPKWSYTVFDFSAKTNWDNSTGVGTIRWDINHTVKPGHYIDVAYIGFFNSPEEAKAFYEAYAEKYDLNYMFKGRKDNLTIDGAAASGLASTSGNSATLEYDFTGKTLAKTDSITFQGWFLSSLGVESYTIRIIGENGETKDKTQSGGNRSDIYTAVGKNSPYNFGQECGNGASFHSKIYLAGFEGQVVDVMVYANTKDGKVINFFNIYNVTVPGEAQ